MPESTIALPESLRFYLMPQNRTAVARLTAQTEPPPALSWEQLEDFYATRFSYQVIKYEHYVFLRDAWKATWGKAIEQRKEFSLLSVGEHSELKAALSPEVVWDYEFVRIYKDNNKTSWWLGIDFDGEYDALHLYWYSTNGKGHNLSTDVDLPIEVWDDSPDTREWRVTVNEACPVAAKMENLDLGKLQRAAVDLIGSHKSNGV